MSADLQPHQPALRPSHGGQRSSVLGTPQRAALRIRSGKRSEVNAELQVTPAGLLSIGGLVGMILFGSAMIVLAAGQARARASGKMNAS